MAQPSVVQIHPPPLTTTDSARFGAPVTALAVDDAERAWAGAWGERVYRQDGNGGWTCYRATNGLASGNVLATVAGGGAAWFGTAPYLSGQGPRDGIARYDLATATWQVYTTAHGLPANALLPQAPVSVYALAMGEEGVLWAGTTEGECFLAGESWWVAYTTTHELRPGTVRALVAGNGTAVAATPAGLDRLDPNATPGANLTLNGSGQDGDEGGAGIVAWDWSSDWDGPLCTSAGCILPHSLLTPGIHSIALKVQDDEGVWSAPVAATVTIERTWRVYLPLVVGNR